MVGEGRARDGVTEGVLRPADIDEAEMHEIEPIWIPLWRVEGSSDTFSIDLVHTIETIRGRVPDAGVLGGGAKRPPDSRDRKGKTRTRRRTLPAGGFRHRDGTMSVLARRGFPIDPGLGVRIPKADLIPVTEAKLDPELTVLPDLPREDAAGAAEHALRRRGEPRSALFASVSTRIEDARLVFYPLYVARYRYGGDAVEGGSSIFFVAVSGTSGKVVASHHPSAWRSVGSKLKRLFGG